MIIYVLLPSKITLLSNFQRVCYYSDEVLLPSKITLLSNMFDVKHVSDPFYYPLK